MKLLMLDLLLYTGSLPISVLLYLKLKACLEVSEMDNKLMAHHTIERKKIQMSQIIKIAIDGPGGAGKSTIAKLVAKELNIDYIDTGAMYRAIDTKVTKTNTNIEDESALKQMLDNTDIDFSDGNIYLDGENVNTEIRTPEMSLMASKVAAIGDVRNKLVALQRNMGKTKSIIMDGRDIGNNVLTDAEFKFFMTASPEERADRRYKELIEKGRKSYF